MRLRKRGLLTPAHEIEHLDKASFKLIKRDSPRSDYPAILDALRDGFPTSQVFIALYETLFTADNHRGLCRCLNIPEQTPNESHKVKPVRPPHRFRRSCCSAWAGTSVS